MYTNILLTGSHGASVHKHTSGQVIWRLCSVHKYTCIWSHDDHRTPFVDHNTRHSGQLEPVYTVCTNQLHRRGHSDPAADDVMTVRGHNTRIRRGGGGENGGKRTDGGGGGEEGGGGV